MKKIIFPAILLAVVCTAGYFLGFFKPADSIKDAARAEASGNFSRALSIYLKEMVSHSDLRQPPPKAMAVTASADVWIKELDKYLVWLTDTMSSGSDFLRNITESIDRCRKQVSSMVSATDCSGKMAIRDDYVKNWNAVFYPDGKTPPESQAAEIDKAVNYGVSILNISGNSNYRYEGSVVNLKSGKRIEFTVFNEGCASMIIPPGSYYLIITAKATFTGGKEWISPVSALSFSAPDSASLLSMKLRTDISRQ
jgi:hypothetical protein